MRSSKSWHAGPSLSCEDQWRNTPYVQMVKNARDHLVLHVIDIAWIQLHRARSEPKLICATRPMIIKNPMDLQTSPHILHVSSKHALGSYDICVIAKPMVKENPHEYRHCSTDCA